MITAEARSGAAAAPGFDAAPFIVIWETTQACDLACRHCRACAQPSRHPDELSTAEAKRMLEEIRGFGNIVFVFSGGDALKRPDILELVAHSAAIGLRTAITPATTPLCSAQMIGDLRDAGLARLAVSLDGSCAAIHDAFRRVDGSFDEGIRILREARQAGLSTQVNTVIARHNLHDFDRLAALMAELRIVFWEVFFLVPTGRARAEDVASAEEFEDIFERLYALSRTAPFDIKATAAPQYSRVVLQRKVAERRNGGAQDLDVLTAGVAHSLRDGIGRARNVNDGDGFMFISHTGEIFPSGFLPVSAGNVRRDRLADVYRDAPLFRQLRDRKHFTGKCGVCEYLAVCGGSRARAYALTGDPLGPEPYCAHVPARWQKHVAKEAPAGGGSRDTRTLSDAEVRAFLHEAKWGVLSTVDGERPYAVPVVFGYDEPCFYLVCAPGTKTRNIERNANVCLTISDVVEYGVRWRSVVVQGVAEWAEDPAGRLAALNALRKQLRGGTRPSARDAARLARARFIRIRPHTVTGRAIGF